MLRIFKWSPRLVWRNCVFAGDLLDNAPWMHSGLKSFAYFWTFRESLEANGEFHVADLVHSDRTFLMVECNWYLLLRDKWQVSHLCSSVVKEEISDEEMNLPCFNGRVVAWVSCALSLRQMNLIPWKPSERSALLIYFLGRECSLFRAVTKLKLLRGAKYLFFERIIFQS